MRCAAQACRGTTGPNQAPVRPRPASAEAGRRAFRGPLAPRRARPPTLGLQSHLRAELCLGQLAVGAHCDAQRRGRHCMQAGGGGEKKSPLTADAAIVSGSVCREDSRMVLTEVLKMAQDWCQVEGVAGRRRGAECMWSPDFGTRLGTDAPPAQNNTPSRPPFRPACRSPPVDHTLHLPRRESETKDTTQQQLHPNQLDLLQHCSLVQHASYGPLPVLPLHHSPPPPITPTIPTRYTPTLHPTNTRRSSITTTATKPILTSSPAPIIAPLRARPAPAPSAPAQLAGTSESQSSLSTRLQTDPKPISHSLRTMTSG